jgi:transketolase
MEIIIPADNFETREAVSAAARSQRPVFLKFGKKSMPDLPRLKPGFTVGKASLIRDGSDVAFIACGETVAPAYQAAMLLEMQGVQAGVISMHTLKPLDKNAIIEAASRYRAIITVEEHSVHGGLGEACAALLLQARISPAFRIIGIPDEDTFTGSQVEIFEHYGITGSELCRTALELLDTQL